jgi:hypothetical protein
MTRSWSGLLPRCLLPLGLTAACAGDEAGLVAAFASPPPPTADRPAPGPGRSTRPTWTVLVYAHGDHELSNTLLADLAEMAGARLPEEVKLIVFADWNGGRTIAGGEDPFPTGSFWYRVRGQGQTPERLREGPELDFDDPAVLAGAVRTAFTEFPADHRGLVLWNHGGAWPVGFGGDTQDGQRPQTTGLPTQQAAAAVRSGLQEAGIEAERPLDFVAFDACLMAGAETLTAFEELAEVFIGDAELDYGGGWDYQATFSWLGEHLPADPRALATFEVQAWDAHHHRASLNDTLLRSHVAVDVAAWSRFVTSIRQMVQALRRSPDPEGAALALQRSMPAYKAQIATPRGSNLRDLGDVLRTFASLGDPALAGAAAAALAAGERARLAVSAGDFRTGQLGVHVFAGPPQALAAAEVAAYPRLAGVWSGASGWMDLIGQLRSVADTDPPLLMGRAPISDPAARSVSFEVISSDAARVDIVLLRALPGNGTRAAVQGTLASAFVRPGRYDFSWNGTLWQVGGAPVTIEPWLWQLHEDTLQAPILASPGRLRSSSGEELPCALLIDARTLQAPALAMLSSGRAAVFDLQSVRDADPGAVFVPVQSAADLRGASSAPDLPAGPAVPIPAVGPLLVREQPAEPGSYLLLVRAADVWGNERDHLFPIAAW